MARERRQSRIRKIGKIAVSSKFPAKTDTHILIYWDRPPSLKKLSGYLTGSLRLYPASWVLHLRRSVNFIFQKGYEIDFTKPIRILISIYRQSYLSPFLSCTITRIYFLIQNDLTQSAGSSPVRVTWIITSYRSPKGQEVALESSPFFVLFIRDYAERNTLHQPRLV